MYIYTYAYTRKNAGTSICMAHNRIEYMCTYYEYMLYLYIYILNMPEFLVRTIPIPST